MWPWEHLAFGYLLYSAFVHILDDEAPTTAAAVALAFGTQFPDLVDKPLAWTFGILSSGVSLAHSVIVAVGTSAVILVAARRLGRMNVATGFVVGYLSHIPADVLYTALVGGRVSLRAFFWPLATAPAATRSGLGENFVFYFVRFLAFLTTEQGMGFLVLEMTFLGVALLVWRSDRYPGVPAFLRPSRR